MWFRNIAGWVLGIIIIGPIVVCLVIMGGIRIYSIFKAIFSKNNKKKPE